MKSAVVAKKLHQFRIILQYFKVVEDDGFYWVIVRLLLGYCEGRYIDDCIGAISSSREGLSRFITSVNSFHPALKYIWEISETSLAFLDIKVSINGNGLRTSVHYKPTDSHSYLLHSLSHPSHVKNSIPYSQFLRLRRLCSDDSDFSNKSQEMCQFFEKRGYPASVIQTAHHRAQQTDRQSALQTSQKEKNDRIPFTFTFHPHNNPVKAIILDNFKILQNDPQTGAIFSQPPLWYNQFQRFHLLRGKRFLKVRTAPSISDDHEGAFLISNIQVIALSSQKAHREVLQVHHTNSP